MKFGVIYADPPWHFATWSDRGQGRPPGYPTMSFEQLVLLPVGDLAADDCVLIMWKIRSHQEQAMALIKAWGFTLKSDAFVWVKTCRTKPGFPIGTGYGTRPSTETAWLAMRGKPKRLSASVRELIIEPRREPGRKPDEAYARIERLFPGPYLELFARQLWPGWSGWGDELDRFGHHGGRALQWRP